MEKRGQERVMSDRHAAFRAVLTLTAAGVFGGVGLADEPRREDRGGLRAGAWVGTGIEFGETARPLDPNATGTGALSRSLRVMPTDPRRVSGFGSVYAWDDQRLVRSSGAVHAVFPRSVVAEPGQIPAGTVFYIGEPPMAPSAPRMRTAEPFGGELASRPDPRAGFIAAPTLEPISPIWDDRRARRVSELLERAYVAGVQ